MAGAGHIDTQSIIIFGGIIIFGILMGLAVLIMYITEKDK